MNACPECGLLYEEGGFCAQDGTRLQPTGGDPLLGAMVGPYRLVEAIGAGGMGRVYKGVNPTIRSRVAIKVLSHDCAEKAELVERFFSEARAVNLIRHESIVNVLDLARLPDGRPYIVMEYLDGAPLSHAIARQGRLPAGTLARFTGEVLDALGAAHAKGIVHRDIKPDNVFVTPHGRAKILDFGIAKLAAEHRPEMGPTRAGSLLGTPHYMSPEQAQARPIDARADLYAVGVILYEATTGRKPFTGSSVYEVLRGHIEGVPVPPRRLAPDLPPAYEQVILRALAKDPAQRFQSAGELAMALQRACQGLTGHAWAPLDGRGRSESVGPPTPGAPSPSPSPAPVIGGRSRSAGLLAAAGAVLAAAVAAGMAIGGAPGQEAAAAADGGAPGQEAAAVADGGAPAAALAQAPASGEESAAPGAPEGAPPSIDPASSAADPGAAAAASASPGGSAAPATAAAGGASGAARAPASGGEPGRSGGQPASALQPARDHGGTRGGGAPLQAATPVDTSEDRRADRPAQQPGGRALTSRVNEKNSSPRSFDVSGYLPRAQAIARSYFPDAVLFRIDADGVMPSGRANLTLDEGFDVTYRFMSPSAAKRPADLPLGVEHKPTCIVYVVVEAAEITGYTLEGWSCKDAAPLRKPRCSAKEIWARGAAKGAPTQDAVASLTLLSQRGRQIWWFEIGDAHDHTFDDDC